MSRHAQESINDLLSEEDTIRNFAFLLILLCIVRLVGYMTVHPRINFILATMAEAADEAIHFFFSFFLMFSMFAVLANFMFGTSQASYATLYSSALTQFKMITAGIDDWGDRSASYVIYVVIVFTIQGLFMLNFFLAIVLGAYDIIKKGVEDQITEQAVLVDVYAVLKIALTRRVRGWPSTPNIVLHLGRRPTSEPVTSSELRTLFRDEQSMRTFVGHYQAYDFLKPGAEQGEQGSGAASEQNGRHATAASSRVGPAQTLGEEQAAASSVPSADSLGKAQIEKALLRYIEVELLGKASARGPSDAGTCSTAGPFEHRLQEKYQELNNRAFEAVVRSACCGEDDRAFDADCEHETRV